MLHRHALLAGLLAVCTAGCDKGGLTVPEPEVGKANVKVDLPAVPAFDVPAPVNDMHSPRELRVKGRKLLDKGEITVKGVITWAYDCPTAIRKEGEKEEDVQKRIDDDPTLCDRPRFYIGDDASTPAEKSLWVVDVPRPYNKLEIKNMKKQDRTDPNKCEPNEDPKKNICPPYKVGDQVEVTGEFKLSSPHSDRNSDGLLVYKGMKNVTQTWPPEGWAPPAPPAQGSGAAPAPTGGPTKPSPNDIVNKGKKS